MILLGGGSKQRQQQDIAAAMARWKDYKRRKLEMAMVLTRDFRETIQRRVRRDPAFRRALLREAAESMLSGDMDTGKAVLRDYINATVGFPELAKATHIPSKSLMRMLGPAGNPRANNVFDIMAFVQRHEGVRFQVKTAAERQKRRAS